MVTGFITLFIAVFGVAVWSEKQEGRITAHDKLFEEREKQEIERAADIKNRLTRIEAKLDSLNGKSY